MRLIRVTATIALSLAAAVSYAQTYAGSGFTLVDGLDGSGNNPGTASGDIVIAGNGNLISTFTSVTITGFTHTWLGDLTVDLYNVDTGQRVSLMAPPDNSSANLNGDYTFVVDPLRSTIDEAVASLSDPDDLAGGVFAMSDYGGGTNPGARTDFSTFMGLPIDGTWRLQVSDWVQSDSGAIQSWSMTFAPSATAPEPGSLALMGLVALPALIGLRRKRYAKLAI